MDLLFLIGLLIVVEGVCAWFGSMPDRDPFEVEW